MYAKMEKILTELDKLKEMRFFAVPGPPRMRGIDGKNGIPDGYYGIPGPPRPWLSIPRGQFDLIHDLRRGYVPQRPDQRRELVPPRPVMDASRGEFDLFHDSHPSRANFSVYH
ncbi:hypothetical protein M5D96_003297 [Drosophila gunungcola]|uniref:Uncharacterized protein n=1 Tax=Drosophila gunungcola TaxID=103775 RepID=A0A9P9YS07_9MUSC|nr:hypothetical protein M5D96_003297 [Drosophila gunungcola]